VYPIQAASRKAMHQIQIPHSGVHSNLAPQQNASTGLRINSTQHFSYYTLCCMFAQIKEASHPSQQPSSPVCNQARPAWGVCMHAAAQACCPRRARAPGAAPLLPPDRGPSESPPTLAHAQACAAMRRCRLRARGGVSPRRSSPPCRRR